MVHTASLLGRSVKGGGGGGGVVIFRVRSPNDSNAAPSGVGGWRVGRGGIRCGGRVPHPRRCDSRWVLSHFLFFSCVFGTVCLDWMLHDPDSRVARMMCHLFIPIFFLFLPPHQPLICISATHTSHRIASDPFFMFFFPLTLHDFFFSCFFYY